MAETTETEAMSAEAEAPKPLSREDIIAAKAAIESLADDPTGWATFAVRGVAWRAAEAIAALEAERDALLEWRSKQAQDIVALGLELSAARARGLEDAAKVADAEPEPPEPMPESLHNIPTIDVAKACVRATKRNIAAAIRALKPGDNELKQSEADAPAKSE